MVTALDWRYRNTHNHTFDVKQNNYMLALVDEDYDVPVLRQARMKLWFKIEPSPVWSELINDRTFFFDQFCDMTHAELMFRCKVLSIPYRLKETKGALIARLIDYWRERFELTSKGKWEA